MSEMERTLVQARATKLWDVSLVEPWKSDYASATMMLAKKYIFGNRTEQHVWGLSPSQKAHTLKEVCHALIRGDI